MSLSIHNIKLSLKIPCIDLQSLEKAFLGNKKKVFRNFFCVSDSGYNYVFFKHRSLDKNPTKQHINVTSIKQFDDISNVIDNLCTKINILPKELSYKIDNISAKLVLNHPLDIEKFQFINQDLKLQYNIEKFPGVFVKKGLQTDPNAKKATFILFASGKINIVGVQSLEILEKSAQWITQRCAPILNPIA